jgi:hypothetical protein
VREYRVGACTRALKRGCDTKSRCLVKTNRSSRRACSWTYAKGYNTMFLASTTDGRRPFMIFNLEHGYVSCYIWGISDRHLCLHVRSRDPSMTVLSGHVADRQTRMVAHSPPLLTFVLTNPSASSFTSTVLSPGHVPHSEIAQNLTFSGMDTTMAVSQARQSKQRTSSPTGSPPPKLEPLRCESFKSSPSISDSDAVDATKLTHKMRFTPGP